MVTKTYSDSFTPRGFLEIYKLFSDGSQEVVLNDHNVVVSGMGVTMSRMLATAAITSESLEDFQFKYIQLGLSGDNQPYLGMGSGLGRVGKSLTAAQYGANTALDISVHDLFASGNIYENDAFVSLPPSFIGRPADDRVVIQFLVDENTANGLTLNEIGVYSKNPIGRTKDTSVLCVYRAFTNVSKSSAFSLVFRWTIEF